MSLSIETLPRKSRLAALLEHFACVEDPFAADAPSGDRIAVSLSVPLGHAAFRQLFADKLPDFEEIAALLGEVFGELAGASVPERVVLTGDQMKVLKAPASGRARDEIEA